MSVSIIERGFLLQVYIVIINGIHQKVTVKLIYLFFDQ
jgi:hypothetical protein